ncbi:MAG: branched-chain amino acid ABC transporter permease [Syntrophobacteraceae bacterium]|nr:branched-chain amino acid ABC transporter permease [Syntrophobacteraceae bacterium]
MVAPSLSLAYRARSLLRLETLAFPTAAAVLFLLPLVLPEFYVYFAALVLVTGLFATSLNLVLGYGGMYQFHHAVFYGAGAYAFALMLAKAHAPLWPAFLFAPLVSAMLGLLIGAICVRLSKLYFGMLQLSLGSLVWAVVFRWYSFTGGGDGLHEIPLPDAISTTRGAYYLTAVVVLICMVLLYRIVNSPFGKIFQAIRDNPQRSEAIGVDIRLHQLKGEVLAAFFAGIAGALYVVVEGSVVPDMMFWTASMEVMVMCLLGGWYTFLGPLFGAAVILGLRTFAGIYTDHWPLILGIILMAVILFFPEGVLGLLLRRANSKMELSTETEPE